MAEANMIRTFICIELPDDLTKKIGDIQAQLKHHSAGISWVRPQNIHLTLKFLGDVEEPRLSDIATAMEEMAAQHSPFTLFPEGQGVFPHTKGPRVFWLGIREDTGTLAQLQQAVEDRLEAIGFAKEKRAFTPHLTIGRVRPYRKPKELTTAFMALAFSADPFEVDHLTIMRSDLKPTGAVYTPLQVIKLK
jgi:2'-5' RNA ligase